jgi:hypothetical protein
VWQRRNCADSSHMISQSTGSRDLKVALHPSPWCLLIAVIRTSRLSPRIRSNPPLPILLEALSLPVKLHRDGLRGALHVEEPPKRVAFHMHPVVTISGRKLDAEGAAFEYQFGER